MAVKKAEDTIMQEKKDNRLTAPKKRSKWKKSRLFFWWLVIKVFFKNLFQKSPLYAVGNHFLEAPTGGGKTLLANIILQQLTADHGFMWSNMDQFDHEKTKVFDPNVLFSEGKQQFKLSKKHCKGLIWDEINRSFNRRLNRSKSYNDQFIPAVEFAATHRHQGIQRVYFLGQSLQLQDTQLQQVFKYIHSIRAKKHYSYKLFKIDNKVLKVPKKLIVIHYGKSGEYDAEAKPIFVPFRKSILKVNVEKHLKTYNQYGFAKDYANLSSYNQF